MAEEKREAWITPRGVLMWPNVWNAREKDSGGKVFDVEILLPADADLKPLQRMCLEALIAKFGGSQAEITAKVKAGELLWPIKPGVKKAGKLLGEHYEGKMYFRCQCQDAPGVIDNRKVEVLDRGKVYGGVEARIAVHAFAYDKKSKGVAIGMDNIQLLGKGQRLSGRPDPGMQFDEMPDDDFDDPGAQPDDRPDVASGTAPDSTMGF